MRPLTNIDGKRYGSLVVIGTHRLVPGAPRTMKCRCDCGKLSYPQINNLNAGKTKSCGCGEAKNRSQMSITHGLSKTKTYRSWDAMKQRCHNPKYSQFKYYGGRGISVCRRWRNSFENFLADMGKRPVGKTIDRIDVNGNYEPNNCRWATAKEQEQNKRQRK